MTPVAIEGSIEPAAREGVIVNLGEALGDPGHEVLECATVMAEVWTFLDGECTDATRAKLCQHLDTCSSCLHQYALEGRIKNLIATKCGGERPSIRLRLNAR